MVQKRWTLESSSTWGLVLGLKLQEVAWIWEELINQSLGQQIFTEQGLFFFFLREYKTNTEKKKQTTPQQNSKTQKACVDGLVSHDSLAVSVILTRGH